MRHWHGFTAVLIVAVVVMIGCEATLVKLDSSWQVPAAEGWVNVTTNEDNSTRLRIHVRHLAKPDRLAPGASVFVAWVRKFPSDAPPENIGALRVNANLEGRLDALTTLHSFELSITPEPQGSATSPSASPVLTAQIGR